MDDLINKIRERIHRCKTFKEDSRKEYDMGMITLSILNTRLTEYDRQITEAEAELRDLSVETETAAPVGAWDVFISYQRLMENEARELYEKLTAAGLRVWQDVQNIRHTSRWSMAIYEALQGSHRLILLMTPQAMASHEVFNEWFYFYSKRKPIHCLLAQDCDIHYQLLPFQYLDWRDPAKRDWTRLVNELRGDFHFPQLVVSTPIVNAPPVDEPPKFNPQSAFADLLEAARDPHGSIALTADQLKTLMVYSPHDRAEYHLTRIAAWSQPRYALDKRFVSLTLLIDQGEDVQGVRWQPAEQRRFTDLRDVLAERPDDKALVLLGAPGSGKSTLLRRLQMDTALDSLRSDDSRLTFFIQLNHFRPEHGLPRDWLNAEWKRQYPEMPPLDTLLHERRMLLLLDALNEMPHKSTADYHGRVELWKQFLIQLEPGNRVLFSCRSLDYSASLSSPDLRVPQLVVQPMSDEQIKSFLSAYLPAQEDMVWGELAGKAQLDIFRTPYFLKLLTEQVETTQTIPRGKAELFTGYVRGAIQREIEAGNMLLLPDGLLTERDHRKIANGKWESSIELPERGALLPCLARLAFAMQQKELDTEGAQIRVDYDNACDLIAHERDGDILKAGVALNVLDEDITRDEVLFFHQLLQEFFAARELAKQPDPERVRVEWQVGKVSPSLEETLATLADSDPLPPLPQTGWEETTVLAAAMTANPEGFVREVMAVNLPLAARCAVSPDVKISETLKRDLQNALIERTQNMNADLRARIAAGLALGEIGDPRFERRSGNYGDTLLSPLVTIPAGVYPMGDDNGTYDSEKPAHTVELAEYQIGMFPVTNAEYALFMAAGGYEDEQWWDTDEARVWLRGEGSSEGSKQQWRENRTTLQSVSEGTIRDLVTQNRITSKQADDYIIIRNWTDQEFEDWLDENFPAGKTYRQPEYWNDTTYNNPAQPVVGVTWFEARAYCNWLTAQTGQPFRLPTEAEFEAAARGKNGRLYPYGDTFDVNKSNTFESHLRRTTPVGIFNNATPEGAFDLSGNVYTWTLSIYDQEKFPYPYRVDDGRNDINRTEVRRVLRGGSWTSVKSVPVPFIATGAFLSTVTTILVFG